MPRLNRLTCSVGQADGEGRIFDEYGVQYRDSQVDCLLRVPQRDPDSPFKYGPKFFIQLQSEGFIAPGLAMFVYIDGYYACNRNRRNLRFPEPGESPAVAEINFKVRQIERFTKEGQLWGQSWAFQELSDVERLSWTENTRQGFKTKGVIEVIVLRCHHDKNRSNPLSAFMPPQPTTLTLNPTKGSWTYVHHGSLFDNRQDNPENLKLPFGCDGGGDDPEPELRSSKKVSSRPQVERKLSLFGSSSAWKKEYVRSKSKTSSSQNKQDQITIRRSIADDSSKNAGSSKKAQSSKEHRAPSATEKKETASLKSSSADKVRSRSESPASRKSKHSRRSHKSSKKQDGGMDSEEIDRLWGASPQFGLGPLDKANEVDLWQWSMLEAQHRTPGYVPFLDLQETESPPRMTDTQFAQAKFDPGHEFDKKLSHVVVREDSAKYAHTLARPSYIDSMAAPYAKFVFRYRDKATIETLLGITIVDKPEPATEAVDPLLELNSMSKEDLIEKLLAERRASELQVNKKPAEADVKATDPDKAASASGKQPDIPQTEASDQTAQADTSVVDQAKGSVEQKKQPQSEGQKPTEEAKDSSAKPSPKDDTSKTEQAQSSTKETKSPKSTPKSNHAKTDSESSDAVIARFAPEPGQNLDDLPPFDPASIGLKSGSSMSPLVQEPTLAGSSTSGTWAGKKNEKKGKQKGSKWKTPLVEDSNWGGNNEASQGTSWGGGNSSGRDKSPAHDNWSSKSQSPQDFSWGGSSGNDRQNNNNTTTPPKNDTFSQAQGPDTPSRTNTYWNKSASPGREGGQQSSFSQQTEKQSSSFRGASSGTSQRDQSAFRGSSSQAFGSPHSPSKGQGNTEWHYGSQSPRGRSQHPPHGQGQQQHRAPSHSSNITAIHHAPTSGGGHPEHRSASGPQNHRDYSSARHHHAPTPAPNPNTSFSGSGSGSGNRSFSQPNQPFGEGYQGSSDAHRTSNRHRSRSARPAPSPIVPQHHGGFPPNEPSPKTAWGASPNLNQNQGGSFNTSFHTAHGGSFGNTYDNQGRNNNNDSWGGTGNGNDNWATNTTNDNDNTWGAAGEVGANTSFNNSNNTWGGNAGGHGGNNHNWAASNDNRNQSFSWGTNAGPGSGPNLDPNTTQSHSSGGSGSSKAEPISQSEVEDLWGGAAAAAAAADEGQGQGQGQQGYGGETQGWGGEGGGYGSGGGSGNGYGHGSGSGQGYGHGNEGQGWGGDGNGNDGGAAEGPGGW